MKLGYLGTDPWSVGGKTLLSLHWENRAEAVAQDR